MAFAADEIDSSREYFARKLKFEKQRADVLKAVESGSYDFVLLDTRGREPFINGHIPGALCVPLGELDQIFSKLSKDKELVTYCWGHD